MKWLRKEIEMEMKENITNIKIVKSYDARQNYGNKSEFLAQRGILGETKDGDVLSE